MAKVGCVVFVSTFFVIVCVWAESNGEVTMVADIVHAMERPSAVLATLCWTDSRKLQLHSALTNTKETPTSLMQFMTTSHNSPLHTPDQYVLFLVDLSWPNISEYFKESYAKKYFRSPFRWILIDGGLNNETTADSLVPEAVEDIQILPDSEVMVARPSSNESYSLYYIYKISAEESWRTDSYGTWDSQNGLTAIERESTAIRRLNLHRYQIPVVIVITDNDSVNHLTDGINDHVDTLSKVNFPSANHLLDFLNATKKYIFVDTWGYNTNGSWDGLTGALARGEAEIGGTPMYFTQNRMDVLEYIISPIATKGKFVFLQPKLSYTNNLFLLSFNTAVWYSLLGLVFIMLLALWAVAHWEWEKYKYDRHTGNHATILRGNFQEVGLVIFGAACQQGSPVQLKGALGRAVMLVLFLALMFLHTSYSANIVALLQSSSSQIKTLEDLLHSRLKFGIHDIVYNRYYFSVQTEPIRKAIYQTKIAPGGSQPRYMSLEEGVKNIRKGLFAFHMETGVGYKLIGKIFKEGEKCGLQEIEYLQMLNPWQAVRKTTPYKEMYKIGLKRIQEHGLQKRENDLLYPKKPKCSGRESHFVSVSMVDCYPALLVLAYGMVMAVLFLCLEILMKKRQLLMNKICSKRSDAIN